MGASNSPCFKGESMNENLLGQIRSKWNSFIMGNTMNIDKLMTQKVEDYILLEEQAMPIAVGKKVIYVGNFNYDNEEKFFSLWCALLGALSARIINTELMEDRRNELLEQANFHLICNGKYMLEFLTLDTYLKKQICKILGKTLLKQQAFILTDKKKRVLKKWKNCSYRYFKKHIKKETLIQICFLIYMYNFDSQKKSVKIIMEKMNQKALEETYIPFWLQNLDGLTGRFQPAPQTRLDSSSKELQKTELPQQKGKADNTYMGANKLKSPWAKNELPKSK